jgi:hypothetical protein
MSISRLSGIGRAGLAALIAAGLAGCGGGGSDSTTGTGTGTGTGTPVVSLTTPTAGDPNSAFTAISGIPLVTSASPTKVNFTVVGSDGKPVKGLTLFGTAGGTCGTANVKGVGIAKLIKGSNNAPDAWQSLITQIRTSGNPGGFAEGAFDPLPNLDSEKASADAAQAAGVGYLA